MRIGIDVRILEKKMCGIGRYVGGILQGISRLEGDDNQYFLFCVNEIENKWQKDKFEIISTWSNIGLPKGVFSFSPFWLNFILPSYLEKYKIDICFFPTHFCPWVKTETKKVIAIYDMAHRLEKKAKNWWRKMYINFSLNQSVKKALAIATISENSRKDILKIYPNIGPEKVFVIYCAADERFKIREKNDFEMKIIKEKYNLPENFVLYVGKIEERKNIKEILKIADLFYEFEPSVKFVLVGNKGYFGYVELKKEIDNRKTRNIFPLEYVSDEDLPFIYNSARVFLFPSLYEGFGLGVLEAMQSGLPVLTSNTSSLPEVVGGAGIMREPFDEQGFVESLLKLLTPLEKFSLTGLKDKDFYNKVRENGILQAKKFSWQKSAESLIRVLENL